MTITKLIYNQTEKPVFVNKNLLNPGEETSTDNPAVEICVSKEVFYRFIDTILYRYVSTEEFVIYLTDQHGAIDQPFFADTTLFMSPDTGNSCLYMARDDTPIINPPIYFYNVVKPKNKTSEPRPTNRLYSWIKRKLF